MGGHEHHRSDCDGGHATPDASSPSSTASSHFQRRSVAASGSSLPLPSGRRGASTELTPGLSRGPLGGYRAPTRSAGTPLRGDVRLGKRSLSTTEFQHGYATPLAPLKRTLLSSALATAPRGERSMSQSAVTPLAQMPSASHGLDTPAAAASPSPRADAAYELDLMRAEYEKRMHTEQQAYRTLEAQLRTQTRELEALKCQRVEVLQAWEAERAAHAERQDAWDAEKTALQKQLAEARAETLQSRARHDEAQAESSAALTDAQAAARRYEARAVQLEAQLEDATLQVQGLDRTAQELRDRVRHLEDEASQRAAAPADDDNAALWKDQLQEQLAVSRRLEAANVRLQADVARLTESCARMDVLRETNRSQESQLRRLDSLKVTLADKDALIATLQNDLARWTQALQRGVATDEHAALTAAANASDTPSCPDAPSSPSPEGLASYVSALRGTIQGLQARQRGLAQSMEQLRTANVDLSRRATQGSETETQLRTQLADAQDQLWRAQCAAEVRADEVQRYRDMVASFEEEARLGAGAHYDATQQKRIQELEARVSLLQTECDALAAKERAARQAPVPAAAPATDSASDSATAALQAQCDDLTHQLEQMAAENSALWTRVGRGEYNVASERCLVLADNPVSRDYAIRTSTLEALKAENSRLLSQVESLQARVSAPSEPATAPADGAEALVPMQTVTNLQAELARLQEMLHVKDKGMLRLKQVFTAKANEFREAVQSLFGYKLRFLENGKVKLTSAYARGARVTTLVFRSNEGNVGEMTLQGEANEGLANVAHLRDYWLSDGIRHSVPCFLAALNLELYENTTQAIRGSFGTDVDA